MNIKIESVTPEKASVYLETQGRNRSCNARLVKIYASDMSEGRWMPTGDPIRFDVDGKLLDGQHRLKAICESGITTDMLVVRGLPADSFSHIDIGRKRTVGDLLSISGETNAIRLGAALRWVLRLDDRLTTTAYSSQQIIDTLPSRPKIRESVELCYGEPQLIPGSLMAALHYKFSLVAPDLATQWATGIFDGYSLPTGHPWHLLRERLIVNASSRAKLRPAMIVKLAIKAWNAVRSHKTLGTLKIGPKEKCAEIL